MGLVGLGFVVKETMCVELLLGRKCCSSVLPGSAKKTAISSYVLALKHITPVPPISMLMVFESIEAFKKNSHFCLCVVVCCMSTLIWGVGGYDMGH